MSARIDREIDITTRKDQLITLNKNLNILLEKEAKYAGNAPLDLVNQIDDHKKAIDLIEQALAGEITSAELDEALKPLLLALRNGQVVEISVPQTRLLRPIALFTLSMVVIILMGIGFLIFRENSVAGDEQIYPTPNPDLLEIIPDWPLTISALTTHTDAEKSTLWIGTESDSNYALYYTDPAQLEKATPKHALDVEERIIGLTVDCKGNVWILMDEAGTRVYRPQTDQADTLLNIETTDNWLTKNTTYAIATRCLEDGTVEVWLGREGIRTLRYESDYPTLDIVTFVPGEEDTVYQDSKELSDIRALLYVVKNQTLWAADLNGLLLSVSFKNVLPPQERKFDQFLWSLAQSPDENAVWVGANSHLIRVEEENKTIPIIMEDGTNFENRARSIAADAHWVWFADTCPETSATCAPLGVFNHQVMVPVEIGTRKSVNDLTIDESGAVWIGTDRGLIVYPTSDKE